MTGNLTLLEMPPHQTAAVLHEGSQVSKHVHMLHVLWLNEGDSLGLREDICFCFNITMFNFTLTH